MRRCEEVVQAWMRVTPRTWWHRRAGRADERCNIVVEASNNARQEQGAHGSFWICAGSGQEKKPSPSCSNNAADQSLLGNKSL
uniref:Uncharacterized protein n=1 Tax=Arundo donax TaxID=35708 RepID=A0A0A9ADS7_ARUDO